MTQAAPKLPQTLGQLPYFHRWLHRIDTRDVLEQNGDFVLRRTKSGKGEKLAISVYWRREIRHFPIQKLADGRYCFESRSFRLIRDLIRWHQTQRVPLTEESGAILKMGKPMLEWELFSAQLDLEEEEIAWGRYGDVCEGKLYLRKEGTERMVAVKSVFLDKGATNDELEEARDSLLHEARYLREVSTHPHIIKFFGVTVDTLKVMLAIELMSSNLVERLQEKPPLSTECKRKMAKMAASALVHVHCHGLVHRHVCAKNCLVLTTATGETVNLKLTGFDFSAHLGEEEEFVDKKMPPLNIAVCAPESLAKKRWTKASDVWSFAVFEYELFNNGTAPYAAEFAKMPPKSNRANFLLNALQAGTRLALPITAPDAVKLTWKACFDLDPKERPTAFDLMEKLSVNT